MSSTTDLGGYLRLRRSAIAPSDVGLPAHGTRRTSGLRREEVAQLANVSVSWYTWLEQGRPVRASVEVVDALARALLLDPIEQDHLRSLAGYPPRGAVDIHVRHVPRSVHQVLLSLEPCPAYVIGPTWDILAWNRAMARLEPAIDTFTPAELNLVWLVFAERRVIELLGDWENEARRIMSQFRAQTSGFSADPALVALVERITAASETFASWWPRHDVGGFESHTRSFDHSTLGTLHFGHQQLIPADNPQLRIIVHLRLEDDDSADRLAALPDPGA